MNELVDKDLGKNGNFGIDFDKENLELVFSVETKDIQGIKASLNISVSADIFIDKLADIIPGKMDDMLLASLKAAMKA